MNEASSKYVDQIAVEKLLSEKLNKVHHYPQNMSYGQEISLDSISKIELREIKFHNTSSNGQNEVLFNSFVTTNYDENDKACCIIYPSSQKEIRGDLIFVHGLYEDNLQIYNYFVSQLNEKGLNVYLLLLPFHYKRKPKQSLFSGEFFWSGDISRSILAFKQSLSDLYSIYLYLKKNSVRKVVLSGFSMGGGISLTLASLVNLDGTFAINPVCNITSLVWNSKLFSPVKNDFEKSDLDYEKVKSRFNEFEPIDRKKIATEISKIAVGTSRYDQINDPENYELLIRKWSLKNVFNYNAGHLNILRVPKLATDIEQLFFRVT